MTVPILTTSHSTSLINHLLAKYFLPEKMRSLLIYLQIFYLIFLESFSIFHNNHVLYLYNPQSLSSLGITNSGISLISSSKTDDTTFIPNLIKAASLEICENCVNRSLNIVGSGLAISLFLFLLNIFN